MPKFTESGNLSLTIALSGRFQPDRRPAICKTNGFALQRKPKGMLNAAPIWEISVYNILIGGHECHSIGEG
jgi:hypothetical protein